MKQNKHIHTSHAPSQPTLCLVPTQTVLSKSKHHTSLPHSQLQIPSDLLPLVGRAADPSDTPSQYYSNCTAAVLPFSLGSICEMSTCTSVGSPPSSSMSVSELSPSTSQSCGMWYSHWVG